jgi:HPt (histidine-containing phosphotransfer) domain-containing protein
LGDISFLKMMLTEFQKKKESYLQQCGAAISAQDPARLASVAHSLKGVAANLGLKKISETARALEKIGNSKNLTAAPPLMEELKDHFQQLDGYLERLDWNALGKSLNPSVA